MANKDLAEFMSSREAESTTWYLDAEAPEIVVTRCESCEAEARHTVKQLAEEFSFVHKPGCAYAPVAEDERSRNDRAYDLAARIGAVLESEPDEGLVVSALAFVSAIACEVASQHSGKSLDEAADSFVGAFTRALPAAAWSSTQRTDWAKGSQGRSH